MKIVSLLSHSRPVFYAELSGIMIVLFTSTFIAQTTSLKLPTADSSSSFRVLNSSEADLLRLNSDAGFYFGGTYGTGVIPVTGEGARLMWYPAKAAFRVGYCSTQWDDANIGTKSIAMGASTTASGHMSTAMGYGSVASGTNSTAMGRGATASGGWSTAMGYSTTAGGDYSTAMGRNTTASGYNASAMGYYTTASGGTSTAMGYSSTASGSYSIAIGNSDSASGDNSIAIGSSAVASGSGSLTFGNEVIASGIASIAIGNYASTNGFTGSVVISDASTTTKAISSAIQEMTMRFGGGYRLFTNYACTTGVTLASGGSSWSSVSDARKKEKYADADGGYFLKNLAQLKLGSWNYIGQDSKKFRHYGPMAQEIFQYFGKDAFGTIGNDTTLASADMDGIMMICLQALEKRTANLQAANQKIEMLERRIEKLEQSISLSTTNNKLPMTNNSPMEDIE